MRGLTFLLIIFTCVVLCACRESSPEKDFSQATAQRGSEKGIFASSALGDAKNLNRYYPVRAFDRDPLTAWGEGADGSGIGQFIGINFKEPVAADTIAVMARFFDSRWHAANNRVKTATIFLDDVSLTAEFNESMTLQTVALGKTVSFKRFMLRIDAIYPGASYDDTCIAEIQFFLQGKEVLIDPELVKKADTKPITFSRIFEEKIRIRNVKTTRDGGYIACGSYHPGNVGETAMLLMKLDVRGNHVWTKHFGKKGTDNYGQYVQELAGGGYIL